jgi:hypothetical protein
MAIRLYRSAFTPMLMSTVILNLVPSLLSLPFWFLMLRILGDIQKMQMTGKTPDMTYFNDNLEQIIFCSALLLAGMVYVSVVFPFSRLICTRLAFCSLHGEMISFGEACAFARSRYMPTLMALAIFILPALVISLIMLIPVLILQWTGATDAILPTALIALNVIMLASLATVLLNYRYFPALDGIIAAAEETVEQSAFAQGLDYLKRAYQLTAGYFWRVFGLLLLLGFAINMVTRGVSEGIQILVLLAKAIITHQESKDFFQNSMTQGDTTAQSISIVIIMVVWLLIPALEVCFRILLYMDLRCRKEGYDLELLLGSAELPE